MLNVEEVTIQYTTTGHYRYNTHIQTYPKNTIQYNKKLHYEQQLLSNYKVSLGLLNYNILKIQLL